MRRIPLGLSLPNRGVLFGALTYSQMMEMASLAEESPAFGSVWVGDSLIAKPRPEAVVLLSALAARTTRLRLGTACLASFNLRHPILLAAQWATLDALSGGRTLLVVCIGGPTGPGGGAGDYETELRAMGFAFRERVTRMEEGIAILRRLWTEDRVTFEGRYYRFADVRIEPRPIQRPTPIWIASSPSPRLIGEEKFRRALRRVARLADGWMTALLSPEEFGERWRLIRSMAEEFGRDPAALGSAQHIMVNVDRDARKAQAEAKAFLDEYYTTDFSEAELAQWGVYGEPDRVADRLHTFAAHGCEIPIVRFVTWNPLGQLETFLSEVAPQLF